MLNGTLFRTSIEFISNSCDVNDKIFVCGDYNLPGVKWTNESLDGSLTPFHGTSRKEILIIDGLTSNK
jgi:hypothetical protein